MISCSRVNAQLKQLFFKDLPGNPIEYAEADNAPPPEGKVALSVTDETTREVFRVCIKSVDLQQIGISLTAWKAVAQNPLQLQILFQNTAMVTKLVERALPIASDHLAPEFLLFFQQKAFAVRTILDGVYQGRESTHLSKMPQAPGIYIDQIDGRLHIFVNLKKTRPLGRGSFGKVKKELWLSAHRPADVLIAKKVFVDQNEKMNAEHFSHEIAVLKQLRNKRGIISLISGGCYNGKYALFFPLYDSSLEHYFHEGNRHFSLSIEQRISAAAQWLEGLSTLAEHGIHGDLSAHNLLFKREPSGEIRAVISDFGTFRRYGQEEEGLTNLQFRSPEYVLNKTVSHKQDVWALGLSIYELFTTKWLPHWKCMESETSSMWLSTLKPHWALQYRCRPETPPILIQLIDAMLDPRPDHRPSAKVAFSLFTEHARRGWKAAAEELAPPPTAAKIAPTSDRT
jgi:hypothetical protein